MSYINSVSETVSAPHNDIEHKKIANLNRRSLTVQVAKVSDDQYPEVILYRRHKEIP